MDCALIGHAGAIYNASYPSSGGGAFDEDVVDESSSKDVQIFDETYNKKSPTVNIVILIIWKFMHIIKFDFELGKGNERSNWEQLTINRCVMEYDISDDKLKKLFNTAYQLVALKIKLPNVGNFVPFSNTIFDIMQHDLPKYRQKYTRYKREKPGSKLSNSIVKTRKKYCHELLMIGYRFSKIYHPGCEYVDLCRGLVRKIKYTTNIKNDHNYVEAIENAKKWISSFIEHCNCGDCLQMMRSMCEKLNEDCGVDSYEQVVQEIESIIIVE